jgi:hypothetical protein
MAIRIQVPLVIEMTDEQVKDFADMRGWAGVGKPTAREITQDVRSYVLTAIQESAAFGDDGAEVSIKR